MPVVSAWISKRVNLNEKPISGQQSARMIGLGCFGGSAPGNNAAIASVARNAAMSNKSVFALEDGFDHVLEGRCHGVELPPEMVSRISSDGGSVIGTSVVNPCKMAEKISSTLKGAGIERLITICGIETAKTVRAMSASGYPTVMIPKSIYGNMPATSRTLGFDTACNSLAGRLSVIKDDSRSKGGGDIRIVEVAGKYTGALAFTAGTAAEATSVFIPEEYSLGNIRSMIDSDFPQKKYIIRRIAETLMIRGQFLNPDNFTGSIMNDTSIKQEDLAIDILALSRNIAETMLRRQRKFGILYGLFVLPHSLSNMLFSVPEHYGADSLPTQFSVPSLLNKRYVGADRNGRPRLYQIEPGEIAASIAVYVSQQLIAEGLRPSISPELFDSNNFRAEKPLESDIRLARVMGYNAVKALNEGGHSLMVCADPAGRIGVIPYDRIPANAHGCFAPLGMDTLSDHYFEGLNQQKWKSASYPMT